MMACMLSLAAGRPLRVVSNKAEMLLGTNLLLHAPPEEPRA